MVERWQWCLKAAIRCHANPQWSRTLSTVLLGLRSTVMNSGYSPAEFVYGTTLRIPGEFVLLDYESADPQIFLEEFREHMRQVKPVPAGHHCKRRVFVHKNLALCTHVFLRVTVSRRSREQPYTGPHKILDRISDRLRLMLTEFPATYPLKILSLPISYLSTFLIIIPHPPMLAAEKRLLH